MGENADNVDDPTAITADFIKHQNEMNQANLKLIVESKKDRDEMKLLLKTLMESMTGQPPRKRRKTTPGEDGGESSALQLPNHREEEIALGIQPGEEIPDINDDEETENQDPEEEAWAIVNQQNALGNDSTTGTGNDDLDEQEDCLEANMGSKFQDLLDQTEEILGDPIDQDLASVVEKTWGKCLLSKEKKEALWKGINIPSNCMVLKAPELNPKVQIRINENAFKKDKAARDRQKGLSRAAIPTLYAMGNLTKAKDSMSKSYKICNREPKSLEEAKRYIAALKQHSKDAHSNMVEISTRIQQSVRVLAYDFTSTTKKRKLDACGALGSAFNPYAQDTKTAEDHLFTEETMKMMKTELNAIKPKSKGFNKDSNPSGDSKNGGYSGKTQRSGQTQGYKKVFSNSGNSNNNNNKNSNKSNRFNKGKKP